MINLSGGEQEQLFLIIRLALGQVLAKEERQLVVLDDAVSYTHLISNSPCVQPDFIIALSLPKGILKLIFMEKPSQSETSFLARLRTALSCFTRALANPDFCRQATELLRPSQPQARPKSVELPPERVHASCLLYTSRCV